MVLPENRLHRSSRAGPSVVFSLWASTNLLSQPFLGVHGTRPKKPLRNPHPRRYFPISSIAATNSRCRIRANSIAPTQNKLLVPKAVWLATHRLKRLNLKSRPSMSWLLANGIPSCTFNAAKLISNRIRNATCLALQSKRPFVVHAASVCFWGHGALSGCHVVARNRVLAFTLAH